MLQVVNHLDEQIIMNVRSRDKLININDINLYDLIGISINPKSSIEIELPTESILYFANVSGTKIVNIATDHLDSNTINVWNHESDIIQCNNNAECRQEDNLVMNIQLPNHIIWYIYNQTTYLLISLILAFVFVAIVIAIMIPIKK